MKREPVGSPVRDMDIQRQFWNGWIADCLERESPDPSSLRRGEVAEKLLRRLNLQCPRILEVGCANGWLSAELAHFGRVTAIDVADEAVARARARYPHIKFVAGDFLSLNLPKGHFDLVVSLEVISVVDDQQSFLERVADLLQPRGHLLLMCPHKFIWDRTDFTRRSHGQIPLNWLNMGDLKRLLQRRFFVLHGETIMPAGNRGILRPVNSARLNRWLEKLVPETWIVRFKEKMGLGKTLVVVARKRT